VSIFEAGHWEVRGEFVDVDVATATRCGKTKGNIRHSLPMTSKPKTAQHNGKLTAFSPLLFAQFSICIF